MVTWHSSTRAIDFLKFHYREDLEKKEECGGVVHEKLYEPIVTMEWLLAETRSFSNLPAFLVLNGIFKYEISRFEIFF